MRQYFDSGATRSYAFRKNQLQQFKAAVLQHEQEVYAALHTDLKKSPEETWVTELGFFISEINSAIKNLRQWMQPERVNTNLVNLPSRSYVLKEPLGVVLIIGPWNYPFQLLFTPLAGAIAAGNCVVLKASEFAPATAEVMGKIINSVFPPEYIFYTTGDGAEVVPAMMNNFRFDHVFYTGNTTVGRLIYKMAADKLVPVTLELGGKSPCVVESDANIAIAGRRIAVTKFSNAGQMCVSPDYVLVHASKKDALIQKIKQAVVEFFGQDPSADYGYCKIINEKQFQRLIQILQQGNVVYGGRHDIQKLYIEPTIIEQPSMDAPIMHEEIFGPIVPIIPFNTIEEAKAIIDRNPNPLAFYVFTSSAEKEKAWLELVSFGGGCVNNASWHLTNHHLPFGGRGNSGIGHYHGRHSFETFSHHKAVMKTPTWFDPDIKYPPFKGKLGLFKKIIR
ncbi:MAG TPA: aldehyde dehydrogenase [Chitinophagaceae bacterium]|nr:aldehyde dehydrogenase [Chitinophagaceae bacterium]